RAAAISTTGRCASRWPSAVGRIELSADDRLNENGRRPASPTGPRVGPWTPRPAPPADRPQTRRSRPSRRRFWSLALFVLVMLSVGGRGYKDLARPEAWAYWKDQYFSPSLTSSLIARADLDGAGHGRRALAIRGTIGPAAASWLRARLDEAHLAPGDAVLLS